jgi:hypothetical protein
MEPFIHDLPAESTCTSCQMADDFSNYWTAVMFFRARNGTFKRVGQIPNLGFEGTKGGMTVYYMQDPLFDNFQKSKVTAFKPGFRMLTGDPTYITKEQASKFRQLTYTCLDTMSTRAPEYMAFPQRPCKAGIMVNIRFPTCWDGQNLDSPNHRDHVAYPQGGTFEAQAPCPESHPVRLPQLMYETIWNTAPYNAKEDWPEDGNQPFVWSSGDGTGYSNHGDYVFGWKGDSLQRILDEPCYVNCRSAKTQSVALQNKCIVQDTIKENIDDCETSPWLMAT